MVKDLNFLCLRGDWLRLASCILRELGLRSLRSLSSVVTRLPLSVSPPALLFLHQLRSAHRLPAGLLQRKEFYANDVAKKLVLLRPQRLNRASKGSRPVVTVASRSLAIAFMCFPSIFTSQVNPLLVPPARDKLPRPS